VVTSLEGVLEAIIDAVPARIAILDEALNLIAVNRAWRSAVVADPVRGNANEWRHIYDDVPDSELAAKRIHDVLDGNGEDFKIEYSPDESRPYSRRITVKLLKQDRQKWFLLTNEATGDGAEEHAALQFERLLFELSTAPRSLGA
jgi:hypothetical protein